MCLVLVFQSFWKTNSSLDAVVFVWLVCTFFGVCAPFPLLSDRNPSKRTLAALVLLRVANCVSHGPFWPLSGPNPSKQVSPAVLFFLSLAVCSFLSLVVRFGLREATASRAAWLSLALQAAVFKEKHGFCPAVLFFLSLAACSFLSQAVRFAL